MSVVTVEWSELNDPSVDLQKQIKEAFGRDGLGVIAIRGVPDWEELLTETLPLAHKLVNLPKESLAKLEHPDSLYNVGWSFGKEKLGDKPDTKKGSFYFNPLTDDPRPELREKYPWCMPANIWPDEELPALSQCTKRLGRRMHEVVISLALHVDKLTGVKLSDELLHSQKAKGRMLYYYPLTAEDLSKEGEGKRGDGDGWIGWHNDSGFLTGLTPDIFLEDNTGCLVPNPEPEHAGLWIADRSGRQVKVTIPRDCMAVQCGECLQVVSGGLLVATPHCVRPPRATLGVSRACCPLFVDSSPEYLLTSPAGPEACLRDTVQQQYVPPLADRWKDGQTFASFLGDTFAAYYSWTKTGDTTVAVGGGDGDTGKA
jgi:isopenicillin N synthase-like dioxygenase